MSKPLFIICHFCFGLVLLIIYTLFRAHTFSGSLGHDDGLFLYAGQAWANGQLPYRDFWDHKPPGLLFFLSIPLRLFPFSILATKLFEVLWLSVTAYCLFFLIRKLFSFTSAIIALPFFILYTSHPYTIRTGGLTEEFALMFVILAYLHILKNPGKTASLIITGFLLGIAVQIRQTFVFEVLFPLGFLFHHAGIKNHLSLIKQVVYLGLGMCIPEIIISLYFLSHGAWYAYFEASYLANFYYVKVGGAERTFLDILLLQWEFILKTGPYLLAPLFAFASYWFMPREKRYYFWLLFITFVGDMIAISLSGEYYEHYYVQAAVTLVLLIAYLIEVTRIVYKDLIVHHQRRLMFILFQPVLVIFIIFTLLGINSFLAEYKNSSFKPSAPSMEYRFQTTVANAVKALTEPEDTILLIGRDPNSVYIFSQRYAGSRYYHYSPLWKEKFEREHELVHQEQFIQDLHVSQPALLLFDLSRLRNGPLSRIEERMPNSLPYIQEHYRPIAELNAPIPDEWFWYDTRLDFFIRRDLSDLVRQRMLELQNVSN